jgi:hypothetical protein
MKIFRFILFILIIIYCAAVISCGEETYTPFTGMPDADLGSDYFGHLIENLGQCQNVYSHLMIEYIKERPGSAAEFAEDGESGYFDLFEAAYNNWRGKHPDKVELIRANVPALYSMVNRITHRNRILHFETMQHVINSYVSAAYINSPAPEAPPEPTEPPTDEDGGIIPPPMTYYPPIDPEYARENIAQYVSADFLSKNPQQAVKAYLDEHNIHVKKISFGDFSDFNHHIYPFRIETRFRLYYYMGDTPVEDEKKWQTAQMQAVYFLGLGPDRNYVIEYISDPRVMQEIIDPDDPTIKDFAE